MIINEATQIPHSVQRYQNAMRIRLLHALSVEKGDTKCIPFSSADAGIILGSSFAYLPIWHDAAGAKRWLLQMTQLKSRGQRASGAKRMPRVGQYSRPSEMELVIIPSEIAQQGDKFYIHYDELAGLRAAKFLKRDDRFDAAKAATVERRIPLMRGEVSGDEEADESLEARNKIISLLDKEASAEQLNIENWHWKIWLGSDISHLSKLSKRSSYSVLKAAGIAQCYVGKGVTVGGSFRDFFLKNTIGNLKSIEAIEEEELRDLLKEYGEIMGAPGTPLPNDEIQDEVLDMTLGDYYEEVKDAILTLVDDIRAVPEKRERMINRGLFDPVKKRNAIPPVPDFLIGLFRRFYADQLLNQGYDQESAMSALGDVDPRKLAVMRKKLMEKVRAAKRRQEQVDDDTGGFGDVGIGKLPEPVGESIEQIADAIEDDFMFEECGDCPDCPDCPDYSLADDAARLRDEQEDAELYDQKHHEEYGHNDKGAVYIKSHGAPKIHHKGGTLGYRRGPIYPVK